MSDSKILREVAVQYGTSFERIDEAPLVLKQNGKAVAVLMSIQEFERYQTRLHADMPISASMARRIANHAVFGDLVGCPLSCDEPVWVPDPDLQWRIPYRLLDGTLMRIVIVDAKTGKVQFTNEDRIQLLEQIQHRMAHLDVASILA